MDNSPVHEVGGILIQNTCCDEKYKKESSKYYLWV
jgi:hypothetical protein